MALKPDEALFAAGFGLSIDRADDGRECRAGEAVRRLHLGRIVGGGRGSKRPARPEPTRNHRLHPLKVFRREGGPRPTSRRTPSVYCACTSQPSTIRASTASVMKAVAWWTSAN